MQSKQPPMPCAVPKGVECKGELIVGPTLRTTSNLALGVVDVILSLSPELTGGLVRLSAVGKNDENEIDGATSMPRRAPCNLLVRTDEFVRRHRCQQESECSATGRYIFTGIITPLMPLKVTLCNLLLCNLLPAHSAPHGALQVSNEFMIPRKIHQQLRMDILQHHQRRSGIVHQKELQLGDFVSTD